MRSGSDTRIVQPKLIIECPGLRLYREGVESKLRLKECLLNLLVVTLTSKLVDLLSCYSIHDGLRLLPVKIDEHRV
jgi:hypothetical protein